MWIRDFNNFVNFFDLFCYHLMERLELTRSEIRLLTSNPWLLEAIYIRQRLDKINVFPSNVDRLLDYREHPSSKSKSIISLFKYIDQLTADYVKPLGSRQIKDACLFLFNAAHGMEVFMKQQWTSRILPLALNSMPEGPIGIQDMVHEGKELLKPIQRIIIERLEFNAWRNRMIKYQTRGSPRSTVRVSRRGAQPVSKLAPPGAKRSTTLKYKNERTRV